MGRDEPQARGRRRSPGRPGPAPPSRCPPHLAADQAAVWSALRLAIDAGGGEPATTEQVAELLRAIDPRTADRPLRVELLLEGLAVDPRTTVAPDRVLGGGEPRYRM